MTVPPLGPVVPGGMKILFQDLTHATDGLPYYPAFDDGWRAGRPVVAPERLRVTKQSSAQFGDAFYATGHSKLRYWFGHVDRAPVTGKVFNKGDVMCRISSQHPRPHVHCAINIEDVAGRGKQLIHHTNYTHGAPKVGWQLRRYYP